jgi:ketosteroid isomerase-like protein
MSICIRPQIILQLVAGYLLFSSLAISGALTNDIKAEIEAASRALVAAQLRYDAPAVARFLTRDFVYVGNDGSLADKTEFVPTAEDKKRRPIGLLKWELLQVRFYGDTAVALYSIHEKSSMNGKLTEFQGRSLAIWVKQNGHWLCAAIHD